ncbi:peptidase S8 [Lottiidibacillus patelloidae]|uniref:Peptidase S8 n=2 Tax=Lottiidibacillus patelloidae TaxID=2670334 RepID=A0A263BS60_9BACI|nr:peptidase S8 [Lottiidibacillus patelloidae]
MDPLLLEEMEQNSGLINVIVSFHGDSAPTATQLDLLTNLGINTGVTMQSLPIAGVLATADQILALSEKAEVRSLFLNSEVKYYNADANELTGVNKVRTDNDMRVANGGLPVSGKGIGVVVNDSGVDGTHPDLKLGENLVENVAGTTNLNSVSGLLPVTYTEGIPNTDNNSGHGTHVAGTVGGTGAASGGKYEGAAPGADLIGYGSGAVLLILDTIGGFDYALTNQFKHDIRIITNSWGSSGGFNKDHPVNIASKKCYDRGIVVLFAAGNEGPGEDTHNPYAKAPWVISVAAGTKDATLADFSSRGTKGVGGTFTTADGETWTWKDEPTITAPGVDIISARAIAPLGALAVEEDVNGIDPAHIPYYSFMSGTSMATPHAAGVVALMLEANPLLSPQEVKDILEMTATNMPGHESWEVGAGYLNAYAAVDKAMNTDHVYGTTLNATKSFNANAEVTAEREDIVIDYSPLSSDNSIPVKVEAGLAELSAKISAYGITDIEEGNTVRIILTSPDGTEYRAGIPVLFSITMDRTVTVNNPMPGDWTLEVDGLYGVGLPEEIHGTITRKVINGFTGINDVEGHAAESAIKLGVSEHLFDSDKRNNFRPDHNLKRKDLAEYLVMGAGIRQVAQTSSKAAIDAVLAQGAAMKGAQHHQGVMQLEADGSFNEKGDVTRAELAYSLIQSLGLQDVAQSHSGDVTVDYKGESIIVEDDFPADLKGYVQLAIDLGIMNVYYSTTQGPYDLEPTIHANFKASDKVTRGEFAVAMTRFFNNY